MKYLYIAILSLFILPASSLARVRTTWPTLQTDTISEGEIMQLLVECDSLRNSIRTDSLIYDSLTRHVEKQLLKDKKKSEEDKARLRKDKKKLEDDYKKLGIQNLEQQKIQLQQELAELQHQKVALNGSISALDQQTGQLTQQKQELDQAKKVHGEEYTEKHRPDLTKAFSKMTIEELQAMKQYCDKYNDDDNMSRFGKQVEQTMRSKQIYDEAQRVLNAPFDKAQCDKALNDLSRLRVSSEQRDEVEQTKTWLAHFEKSYNSLIKFIEEVHKRRASMPNADACKTRIDNVKNNNKDLMASINAVPSVKTSLEQYVHETISKFPAIPALEKQWCK